MKKENVTFLELMEYRRKLAGHGVKERYTETDFNEVGLTMIGGCVACGETLSPARGHPSDTGFWRCPDDIGPHGFETVEEANAHIFPTFEVFEPEDEWSCPEEELWVAVKGHKIKLKFNKEAKSLDIYDYVSSRVIGSLPLDPKFI